MVAYLMVSVDGVVTAWTEAFNPTSVEYDLPPLGVLPNKIDSTKFKITELVGPPVTVVEGEPFTSPVTIQIGSQTGDAYYAGVMCFVYIDNTNSIGTSS